MTYRKQSPYACTESLNLIWVLLFRERILSLEAKPADSLIVLQTLKMILLQFSTVISLQMSHFLLSPDPIRCSFFLNVIQNHLLQPLLKKNLKVWQFSGMNERRFTYCLSCTFHFRAIDLFDNAANIHVIQTEMKKGSTLSVQKDKNRNSTLSAVGFVWELGRYGRVPRRCPMSLINELIVDTVTVHLWH